MIEQILALSWGQLFSFGFKFISAWTLASFCIILPLMIIAALCGVDLKK